MLYSIYIFPKAAVGIPLARVRKKRPKFESVSKKEGKFTSINNRNRDEKRAFCGKNRHLKICLNGTASFE